MKELIKKIIDDASNSLKLELGHTIGPIKYTIEVPKNNKNGDFASNIAFVLSHLIRKKPIEVAKNLINLMDRSSFDRVEIAGTGFINFFVGHSFFYRYLDKVVKDERIFYSNIGDNKQIQIEFISANPTGPLHIGHGRGAVIGDSLARILTVCGYKVTKEYYLNDVGNQINNLGASIMFRYKELLNISDTFPDDGYKGDYITDIAKIILDRRGDSLLKLPARDAIKECSEFGEKYMIDIIKHDLEMLDIKFDIWFSEKSLYDDQYVEKAITLLRENEFVYTSGGAVWFRSTSFNDDKDRVLKRSNGDYTYFASDIAYHLNKFERGFDKVIDIWGSDHHGYIKRLKSSIKALGLDDKNLDVILIQMLNIIEKGKRVSMSTRRNEFIPLKWLINNVGKDALRYFYLMRTHDSQFDFDMDLAKSRTSDNPVYYVQYAYARVKSIFRNAMQKGIGYTLGNGLERLELIEEIELIKKIYSFKDATEQAAINYTPHRLTYYLHELAGLFHNYYYNNKILVENDLTLTSGRISLSYAVSKTIKQGLNLIGVDAPERM